MSKKEVKAVMKNDGKTVVKIHKKFMASSDSVLAIISKNGMVATKAEQQFRARPVKDYGIADLGKCFQNAYRKSNSCGYGAPHSKDRTRFKILLQRSGPKIVVEAIEYFCENWKKMKIAECKIRNLYDHFEVVVSSMKGKGIKSSREGIRNYRKFRIS